MKRPWVIVVIISWLVFVVSLTLWWLVFSLRLISQLKESLGENRFEPHQKMLILEGGTLIALLIVGGVALVYFALREQRRFEESRLFFSTFSHDLKTSISRLLLQGERLFAQSPNSEATAFHKNLLDLELQLENSLHLAQQGQRRLALQEIQVKQLLSRLHSIWPELKIQMQGEAHLQGDAVALESILKNLVSNSVLHAEAEEIRLRFEKTPTHCVIHYSDDGKAFEGDMNSLSRGDLHPSEKGTGIGLYIVHRWFREMNGQMEFFLDEQSRLQVRAQWPLRAGGER